MNLPKTGSARFGFASAYANPCSRSYIFDASRTDKVTESQKSTRPGCRSGQGVWSEQLIRGFSMPCNLVSRFFEVPSRGVSGLSTDNSDLQRDWVF